MFDNNGTYDNATVYVNVTGVNDAPVNTAPAMATTLEDVPIVFNATNGNRLSTSDVDLGSSLIRITFNVNNGAGTLTLSTTTGLTFAMGDGTADVNIVFRSTLADANNAIDNLTFTPTPNFNGGTGSFGFQAADEGATGSGGWQGDNSNVGLTITSVNDISVITNAGGTVAFTEDGPAVIIDNDITITDVDDANLEGAWINITANYEIGIDTLEFINTTNILGSFSAGILTLVGTDTVANYQAALRTVTFNNTNQDPSPLTRTIQWQVTDGELSSNPMTSTVTFTAVNDAPVLAAIGNQTVNEEVLLAFTATATDLELDGLTFSLEGTPPAGAVITAGGDFTWTPTEADGPGFYNITIRVTDDGTPNLYDNETIMVTVGEVNLAPVLTAIGNQTVNELALLAFTATATDNDLPANTLTFSLSGTVPTGATIDPNTGVFTWTPTEAQGPGFYNITIRVSDGLLEDFEVIMITVGEVNVAPILTVIGNRVVNEETTLTIPVMATDADLPANTLTFILEAGAPTGASITSGGLFTWTPTETQGPGFYNITVRVTDNGVPALFDNQTFMVKVNDVNVAPTAINDVATLNEDSPATQIDVLANDNDHDLPANTITILAFTQGTHGAVAITGGILTYEPVVNYYGIDTFTYTITDGTLSATATVTVTIANVNDNPVATDDTLTMPEDGGVRTILVLANDDFAPDVGETLTITAVTQGLHGAVIITNGGTRVTYEPVANYYGTDTFTYTISDGHNGTATATVTILVTNVNDVPLITTTDVTTAVGGENYTVDYAATDIDLDTLTWGLTTNADWLSINPATGVLNGTAEAGSYNVLVIVSDGTDSATHSFTLTVTEKDSDSDGVPDSSDAFPNNANETVDTDADGIGNNADTDDDGDGVADSEDDFPLNSSETTDTDHDGIGNNADLDDDGDGVSDTDDPEPLNSAVTGNEYVPGWPYWYVLIVIGIAALIGLIGLGVVWFLYKRP
ncbi:MAG: Ig-like domain-containing protein [Thermoplasmata archaeon]|nr:Ig-like domain-containing protein [Thermoplasmata archaeon]